jgi:hypothetical protein
MASLDRTLRRDLETTVKKARRVAEAGARKAVAQLGVGETEAPKHLSAERRTLRNRIRAHGRQLGDRRDAKTGIQDIARLIQECAYEHWHRMLFARFLAETDLLIEPESGVAITLDEVQELAREKATDWLELASDYAEQMLPQIFRKDDPVLQIAMPPETRSELEDLLKGLSKTVFEADDSLGWVYQFWQADKKDEVNKSEVKIGADELPAVTQLFTEDYMVLFLLHNTLGAWWAGKVLAKKPALAATAASEDALRSACKVGNVEWTYLRFVRDKAEDGAEGPWRPAAGVFESWPKAAKDLTVLDPCMGSGHFLVFTLPILVAFRMSEEDLSQSAAVDAVLQDNLFGLEIDPRCTQIAAFNLAFAAWRKVGHRSLPQLNLACSGLAIGVTKAEWLKLAEKAVTAADPGAKRDLLGTEQNLLTVGLEERVKNGLEALYDLFVKAPWLGSLIDPRRAGADIFHEGFDELEPLLASILRSADTDDAREMAVAAQGMAKAAQILGSRFTLTATNVPYLGRGKQHEIIRGYCEDKHPSAKSDVATCFIERCANLVAPDGTLSIVTPQNWLFLNTYKKFRATLLKHARLNIIARLGEHGFESPQAAGAFVALINFTSSPPSDSSSFCGLNASDGNTSETKLLVLKHAPPTILLQREQVANPDHRIAIDQVTEGARLSKYCSSFLGLGTGDYAHYGRCFWEFPTEQAGWTFQQATVESTRLWGGREHVLAWDFDINRVRGMTQAERDQIHNQDQSGQQAWGRMGIAVGLMRDLKVTIYTGERHEKALAAIIPQSDDLLPALWTLCKSREFYDLVRELDHNVIVANGTLVKIPFEIEKWKQEAAREYPDGLPKPYSDDPTQWLFSGHPGAAEAPLQVAVARLASYQWPRQTGSSFADCPALSQDGLAPHAHADGIVCLTALKGEPPAEQRLNALLADAFDADWSAAKLASLLAQVGFAGRTLDDWLRDGFFTQHCELFHQRPFVWHVWDGRRDGFHTLVNYHRLAAPNGEGRRTLEKLIYSYLGDWIDRQRADQRAGVEGADARLAHSEHLKAQLIRILEGEAYQDGPSYDIFVRWKPLHEQPVGWDPDINDGVRMNIRPFMTARTLNARGANTCILRSTPKIKWDKDRGKEPTRDKTDYPWFWGWDESSVNFAGGTKFDGNRWNDLHYSRATKHSARDRHRASVGGKA